MSFIFPKVSSVKNNGEITAVFRGPFDSVQIVSGNVYLNDFSVLLDDEQTIFQSPFTVNSFQSPIRNGRLNVSSLVIDWEGDDTFRKVTRKPHLNRFKLHGSMALSPIDFLVHDFYELTYDLSIKPTFISVDFPTIYSGDIKLGKSKFKGAQQYSLSLKHKAGVKDTIGKSDERGRYLIQQFH